MAGPWLKIECATPDKPHMLAITAAMGWDDPDLAFAKLFRLWRWFDQHTVDGNAAGVTPALLDRVIGVTGFVQAVANVGWLVISEKGISLARFEEHNGDTAKNRAQTAKRVALHKSNATGNGEGNANDVSESVPRGRGRDRDKYPPTPLEEIVELYHAKLPELPRVVLKTAKRDKACREFWGWVFESRKSDGEPRAQTADQALTWIAGYFDRASANDFLMGRRPTKGHENWRADFDFLLTERGRTHVIERTVEA